MIRVYPILAVPAPRQVRSDAWRPTDRVQRYHAFRDEVRIRHVQIPQPFHHVIFVLPIPPSWSQKRKLMMEGMPHQQTPDRDNLEKALLDSVFGQDCAVWDGRTTKVWGAQAMIIVAGQSLRVSPPMDLKPYYAALYRSQQDNAFVQDIPLQEGHMI